MERVILPKSWKYIKFSEALDIQGGSQPPKSNFIYEPKEGYIQLLQIRDYGERGVPTYVPKKLVTKFCKKEDVMIARYGASLGRIITGLEGAYNVALAKVIDEKGLFNRRYIFYLLKTPIFQTPLKLLSRSAQNGFSKSELAHIELPLPPFSTQQLIVSKIEELFSELDKGIENLKTAQQQLKVYRQAVLKWAFEGKLTNENVKEGELPKGWTKIKLEEVVSLSTQKHKPLKEENLFYIGLEHIEKNSGRLTSNVGIERITTIKNKFSKGNLLYGKLRPNLNKCYLARESGVCSTDILVLELSKNCLPEYLHPIMLSAKFVNEMSENTSGVNLPRVSTKFIMNYHIPLPPIEEQKIIIEEIESRISVADKMEESINDSLKQAEALRQSILKKAFEGKLI